MAEQKQQLYKEEGDVDAVISMLTKVITLITKVEMEKRDNNLS